MPAKPKNIDEYLALVTAEQRAALEKLRKQIHALAPEAEECINYGIAAFRLDGKSLVGFGAGANHCTFFPMSGHTVAQFQNELKGFETSKGAIRFQPNKPLPLALLRKLVNARLTDLVSSSKAAKPRKGLAASQTDTGVVEFLRKLKHPLKKDLEAVREIILGVSPKIGEGIKWSAPSFRTTEYFATMNVRDRDKVQLIFHLGAKVKDNTKKIQIADPKGLMKWLAADRCLISLGAGKEIQANRKPFEAIVRKWITYV